MLSTLIFLTVSHLKPVIYICHGSENCNYYIASHATTEDISLNQWNSMSLSDAIASAHIFYNIPCLAISINIV